MWPFTRPEYEDRDVVRIFFPGGSRVYVLSHTAKEIEMMRKGWHTFKCGQFYGGKIISAGTKRVNLDAAATMTKITLPVDKEITSEET